MSPAAGKHFASIRRALSLSFVQTGISAVFTFVGIVIVSHLLTPAEIGVFSIAAGLVVLVHMLRDFGVTEFLIQEEQLDEAKIRTVFTLNLLVAWLLAGSLFACSRPIGDFYGDPGVVRVLRVLSFVFALMPFGTVSQTLMKREMEFGAITKIQLGQNISRACATVALAYAGFSYMSMAWAALLSTVVMVAGCVVWGWHYRVRGLSLASWRQVLSFGTNRTLSDVVTQLGEQSANLVIGRTLGMADTGLYSRGYGIVNMFRTNVVATISSVAFPAFAREHRATGTAPQLFLKALVYLSGISWPFFAAGLLLADPLIRILFGDQWVAAVPLMRWLCAAAVIATLTYQCNQFLVALGQVRAVTRTEVEIQVVRIGLTIGAAFYSVVAVAAVQSVVYVAATCLYYARMRQFEVLSARRIAAALRPSVVVAVATCIAPAIVALWPGFLAAHMLIAFTLAVSGGCLGWLVAVRAVHHPLLQELQQGAVRFAPVLLPLVGRPG